ncbi:MAG: type II toxin-antitoxin system VapC family toxin [Deltaproteobacteria bacterium]|nr:type II toxin-antitoxin system VapC family toxin [Deltaproteobacteria bacterium]
MTQLFFQTVRARKDALYISDLVLEEIDRAPNQVRFSLMTLVRRFQPRVLSESHDSLSLAQEYVAAHVVPARSRDDARHIAIATLAGSDALVSWNFRHLVNLKRKRLVHSVNIRLGHPLIEIVSPEEVVYE